MKKFILLVTLLILCLLGCHQESAYITTVPTTEVIDYSTMAEKIGTTGNEIVNGTTCGNITFGSGRFAYKDGFIYFADWDTIYEYDLQSKVVISFLLDNPVHLFCGLSITDTHVSYVSNGLHSVTRDGKHEESVLWNEKMRTQCFADGNEVFYLDGIGGNLFCYNTQEAVERKLIENVNGYFVTNDKVYAIAKNEKSQWALYVCDRAAYMFSEIQLSFQPIAVYVKGEEVYLAQRGAPYSIVKYVDGTETILPIGSCYFQTLGENVLFLDDTEYSNSTFPLKSYNVKTGEIQLLCEKVYDFCILENRYVCCMCLDGRNLFIVIDMYTDTVTDMLPEPEG